MTTLKSLKGSKGVYRKPEVFDLGTLERVQACYTLTYSVDGPTANYYCGDCDWYCGH